MRLLLHAYPRRWRERYGEELLALLDAEPLTARVCANVVAAGLGERLRCSGPPHLRMLWAWSLFVIGGTAFQKTSEHWQMVVPRGSRGVPTAAFDVAQVAAAVGSAVVLVGVAVALPAFVRDLRRGGWTAVRRPILLASAATTIAAAALVVLAFGHDVAAAFVFVAFALCSLVAWTHAAVVAARRLEPLRVHAYLVFAVSVAMVVTTAAACLWLVSVSAHAPSFVGATQLAVVAAFMLGGTALAATAAAPLRA